MAAKDEADGFALRVNEAPTKSQVVSAKASTSVLPHSCAYVLMHVDGVSSVETIAKVADLPLEEVVMYFLELAALGLVTMNNRRSFEAMPLESMPPDSHVHRKSVRD